MGSAACPGRATARAPKRLFIILTVAAGLIAAGRPAAAPEPAPSAAADGEAAGPARERVVQSDAERLVLALEAPEPTWTEHVLREGTLALHAVDVAGFPRVGEPGRPELPRRAGWIVVPPGKRPVLRTLREEWRPLPRRQLLVGATPVVTPDPDGGQPSIRNERLLPGERPRRGTAVEGLPGAAGPPVAGALELGEPTRWRGRRIVSYVIAPVQADGEGHALRSLAVGEWEVRFVPDPAAGRAPAGEKRTTRGDDRFGGAFLNAEALASWPTEAAALPAVPKASAAPPANPSARADLLAPEVKIAVKESRLHRVGAAELRQSGLLPQTPIAEEQIRLYQRYHLPGETGRSQPWVEIEVPVHMVGDGGLFEGGDYFLFWGLRPRDDLAFTADLGQGPLALPGREDPHEAWSGENIYWLAAAAPPSGTTWARMESRTLAPAAGQPASGYRRVDYLEEDYAYEGAVLDISHDRNHWNDRSARSVEVRLPIRSPDPATAGDAQMRVGVVGWTDRTVSRPLAILFKDGSRVLGTVATADPLRIGELVVTGGLPEGWAQAADPRMRIQRLDSPDDYLYAHLDWLEVSYGALYRAGGGKLQFPAGDGPEGRDLRIGGFGGTGLGLVEITDGRRPAWIELGAGNLVPDGGGQAISIHVPGSGRVFYAEDGMTSAATAAVRYELCKVDDGVLPMDGAPAAIDLLVVAHPEFKQAIGRWIEHRRLRGGGLLNVHLALIDDVYDAYSGGLVTPWALKRFVADAIGSRGAWALQLVGDANENVRELGNGARPELKPWCWIPTHLHVQNTGAGPPEVLAADEWYPSATVHNYPDVATSPPQMLVGRFPCNSTAELNAMIDKVLVHEAGATGQPWRRRGIFFADDAWSSSYGASLSNTRYSLLERDFQTSEETMAGWWEARSDAALVAHRFFLADYLDPFSPPPGTERNGSYFRTLAELHALPPLLSLLGQGALVVHFQGHANAQLLTHEAVLVDQPNGRRDVARLSNTGRPWVFFGMGCHIADWAQNSAMGDLIIEPAIGEKLLSRPGVGAAAVYASSGYEYLTPNVMLSEILMAQWVDRPPVRRIDGGAMRSRWVLGELLWRGEAEALANNVWGAPQMAAQYVLLGDVLLALDAGPPIVGAVAQDAGDLPLSGTVELSALDAGNRRLLRVAAADEAGIDRLEVTGSDGADLGAGATLVGSGGTGHQRQTWEVSLPVRPFDHDVTLRIWDTARPLPTDAPWELRVRLPQTASFRLEGEPITPAQIPLVEGEPLNLGLEVRTAAWLDESWPVVLSAEGLDLSGIEIRRLDAQTLDLTCTAVPRAGTSGHELRLAIDGHQTVWRLGEGDSLPPRDVEVQAFPNPMSGQTRFLVRVGSPLSDGGRIVVFSLAGRRVASVPVRQEDSRQAQLGDGTTAYAGVVPWDGRDGRGDELANGVYLYRAELDGPAGRVTSPVQRLVIMR